MWWFIVTAIVFLTLWWLTRPKEHIKYYVIHLKGHKERENNIQNMERILGQSIHIFDAVRGSSIDDKTFQEILTTSEKLYNKNEVGCYMSHHKILQKLSNEHTEYTVVFEDDFKIFPDTHEQISALIKEFPDFDIIMLGNHSNTDVGEEVHTNICKVHDTVMIGGTNAYIVRNDTIHTYEKKLRRVDAPIDLKFYNHIKTGEIEGYIRCPALTSHFPFRSTLGHH